MKEALSDLSNEQISFICSECSMSKERLFLLNDDDLYNLVYDQMCDIELAEIPAKDEEEESPRCILASGIVTTLGNTLDTDKYTGFDDE